MARILLVDDDIAEISAVKRVLARGGHKPVLATNGLDALGAITSATPDLVLVSSMCAGGNALRVLAEDPTASALPTAVIGDSPDAPAGAPRVSRPVDPQELSDAIAAAISGAPAPPAAGRPSPPRPGRTTSSRMAPPAAVGRMTAPSKAGQSRAAPALDPSRRATADAIRARAAELRKRPAAAAPEPPPPEAAGQPEESPVATADGMEAILRRAEVAERAHAAEKKVRTRLADRNVVEAAQRAEAERYVVDRTARARIAEQRAEEEGSARVAAEERARKEAAARAKLERAHAEAEKRARHEERSRAEAERRAHEEERSRAEAEKRAQGEGRARAEAEKRAQEEERARTEAEKRAREGERARAEAEKRARDEERARAEAEKRAREGERARDEAEKRAREEEKARAEAEKRIREEERARAEVERRAREEARKAAAEAAERDKARRAAEDELNRLRAQLEEERRGSEAKLQSVIERARAEERAAEELRRLQEEEAKDRAAEEARRRAEEDERLHSAVENARAQMEELLRRNEEEKSRRADAEAELSRLAREAERRAAEAAAMPRPFDLPVYRPPGDGPAPEPDGAAAGPIVPPDFPTLTPVPFPETSPPVPAPEPLPGEQDAQPAPSPAAPAQVRPLLTPVPDAPPAPPGSPRRASRTPPPELRQGTVAEVPLPRLVAIAARAELTGRIDFEGEVARSIWFEDGRVVGATSAIPSDRVEELALRMGLINRDQHRQIAQASVALASRRAALLLLERGFLKPTELTPLVRRRTEEIVFGIFGEADASFRFVAEEVPQDERIALERSPLALAVEGVRRRWLEPQVEAVVGGPGTLLAPIATGPSAAELGLSPEEARAVALADGLRTLDEIVSASPLDSLSTRQVLAALVLVGGLAVRAFQGGHSATAASAAIDLVRVRDKLDQVRRADYFTILGIGRLSTPYEIREAADRLLAEFDPARFAEADEEGLEQRLAEILSVVGDARDVLSDDRLREEYLQGLGD